MAQAQPATDRNGGYSLSGLYLLTNPARLNLPGTKVPAGIALKVTEPHKLHHHVEVITHGEAGKKVTANINSDINSGIKLKKYFLNIFSLMGRVFFSCEPMPFVHFMLPKTKNSQKAKAVCPTFLKH